MTLKYFLALGGIGLLTVHQHHDPPQQAGTLLLGAVAEAAQAAGAPRKR